MSESDPSNGRPTGQVAVTVHFDRSGEDPPRIDLSGMDPAHAVTVLHAALGPRSWLAFCAYALAIVARDPASNKWERNTWADRLVRALERHGPPTGYRVDGLEQIEPRPVPGPPPPKHRRLPKPKRGRRAEWTPEYVDAVAEIVRAARSENARGLTVN